MRAVIKTRLLYLELNVSGELYMDLAESGCLFQTGATYYLLPFHRLHQLLVIKVRVLAT